MLTFVLNSTTMALFKTGAIVTDIRGKIGGLTFVQTSHVKVIKKLWGRTTIVPHNNHVKNAMSVVSQSWQGIAGSDKASWLAAASNFPAKNRFGDTYTPVGFQIFMQFNLTRILMGNAIVTTAPSPAVFPPSDTFGIGALNSTTFEMNVGTWADASFALQVDACVGSTGTNRSITGGYKFIGYFAPPVSGPVDCFSAYIAVFGQILTGARISVRYRFVEISSGIAGAYFYDSKIAS